MEEHNPHAVDTDMAGFTPADYVIVLPQKRDDYGEVLKRSYNLLVLIVRNLLAAKLEVSWFPSTCGKMVFIRASANHDRLVDEAERVELQRRQQVRFKREYDPDNETFTEFQRAEEHTFFNTFKMNGPVTFTSLERQRLVLSIMMAPYAENGAQMQEYAPYISDMYPMHDEAEVQVVMELSYGPRAHWYGGCPIRELRDYFGEEVALHFAFLDFETQWLSSLALGAVCVQADQFLSGRDTLATPIFALFAQIWAICIMEFWVRKENTLKSQWNVENFEETETTRPEFKGALMYNSVSGIDEMTDTSYWTPFKRVCGHLAIVFTILIATSIALAPTLARSYFLESADYLGVALVAAATYLLLIPISFVTKRIALWITDIENHRTETEYQDNLIFKTFVLQFMPIYGPMLWTAFVQDKATIKGHKITCGKDNCFGSLSVMLAVQFTLYLINDNVVDIFYLNARHLPSCGSFCKKCSSVCRNMRRRFRRWLRDVPPDTAEYDRLVAEDAIYMASIEESQLKKHPYPGPLSEYNELFIQYGYIFLFAPAFPLVVAFGWLNNLARIQMDAFKLCELHRRPQYTCAEDIGSWMVVLRALSVVSVISNSVIVVYTSNSLDDNDLFDIFGSSDDAHHLARLAVCMGLEHIMFFVRFLIAEAVPDITIHVKEERKKRAWEKAQEEMALFKKHDDENHAYVIRQRTNEAPDEYEHHIDEI